MPAPVIDPVGCTAHFGLGRETWRHACLWQKGFNELVAPIRYDRRMRLRKRLEGLTAAGRLDAGALPEALELPNVGVPPAVPIVSFGEHTADDTVEALTP